MSKKHLHFRIGISSCQHADWADVQQKTLEHDRSMQCQITGAGETAIGSMISWLATITMLSRLLELGNIAVIDRLYCYGQHVYNARHSLWHCRQLVLDVSERSYI